MYVPFDDIAPTLAEASISILPGVGPSTLQQLEKLHVTTCGDLLGQDEVGVSLNAERRASLPTR